EEDPRRNIAVAGPVADAAERREPFVELVHPDLLARLGTKRDDPIAGWHVHDAVDDDRRDLLIELERGRPRDRTAVAIEAVVPDELEAGDVLGRQPVERREARPGEIAMIVGPIRRIAPAARRGFPGGRARVLLLSERRPREC